MLKLYKKDEKTRKDGEWDRCENFLFIRRTFV